MSEEEKKTQETKKEESGEKKPVGMKTFPSPEKFKTARKASEGGKKFFKKDGFKGRGKFGGGKKGGKGGRDRRKRKGGDLDPNISSEVIAVRRVTRVAKGGKKMRFSALVVVGDKNGKVGYSIKKGVDFQSAVGKAQRKAQSTMIKVKINDEGSIDFPTMTKYKAAQVFLKPAKAGTGLIAGGYVRPVLELAGVQNIYSKIVGGTNKISGVQAMFEALSNYEDNRKNSPAKNQKQEVKK